MNLPHRFLVDDTGIVWLCRMAAHMPTGEGNDEGGGQDVWAGRRGA